MSKTTTKYSINQFKQIIPLNENIVNFELNFEVKSENNLPFKVVVLSDEDLNSEKSINYQEVVNGVINGNIVNDKGIYKLYYLLLKADQLVDCDVTLDIKEVPINPEIERIQQEQINQQRDNVINIQRHQQHERERNEKEIQEKERQEKGKRQLIKKVQEKEESKTNWLIIFVIIGIVAFGIWFLFFYKKKKKQNSNLNLNEFQEKAKIIPYEVQDLESILRIEPSEVPKIDIISEIPKLEIASDIEVPKITIPVVEEISKRNNNLLNRLNNYFDN